MNERGMMNSTCMKVCRYLFPVIPSSMLDRLLSIRVMNIIKSNSGNSKNYMHEQAVQLLDFFVTVIMSPVSSYLEHREGCRTSCGSVECVLQ